MEILCPAKEYSKVMELHSHSSLVLPWEKITLAPLGDFQHGSQSASLNALERHITRTEQIGCLYTGLGDYLDVASPSGRSKYNRAEFYDSVKTALDNEVYRQLEEIKQVLKPTIGKWLILNMGHHHWTFCDGTTTDSLLAEYLGCPVTDDMGIGITSIKFQDKQNKKALTCEVWQWHGTGSSTTMAGPVNKLEREMISWPSVDIFLMGHYSRAVGWYRDPLIPKFGKNPRVVAKRRVLACTGSFDYGYTVGGKATYVEKGGMPPLNHGSILIEITPTHKHLEDCLDMHFV